MADPSGGGAATAFNFKQAIAQMIQRNGSDLLLKVGRAPTVRVNGDLATLEMPALKPEDLKLLAEQVMTPRQVKEFAEKKEADFAIGVPGVGRFRTNIYQQRGTLAFAFRAIPYEVKTIRELNLPPILEEMSLKPRGLVLVTGITGSGKSTTLAAMLDFMNRTRNDHIVTIEDPVEFVHEDKKCVISQREIGQDSTSFAQALRAALRQDPDIILVGEMRDAETMEVALHAAETGHLVLSTLHTLNATETINRIISIFPPHQEDQIRAQLSAVIQGVVSQRLVVRADGKGRVPAVEVMMMTGLIRESIREKVKTPQIPTVIASGQAQYGMQTFDQSLLGLYRQELVTYETARDAATNPDDFDLKVKGIFSTGEMTWDASSPGFVGAPSVGRLPGPAKRN